MKNETTILLMALVAVNIFQKKTEENFVEINEEVLNDEGDLSPEIVSELNLFDCEGLVPSAPDYDYL